MEWQVFSGLAEIQFDISLSLKIELQPGLSFLFFHKLIQNFTHLKDTLRDTNKSLKQI